MADYLRTPVIVSQLNALNEGERQAIRAALEYFIFNHGERDNWAQRAVLEDMLPKLFWGQ